MARNSKIVRWASNDDLRAAILGAMGFSTKFITAQTGLTPCQVTYRLRLAGIKRADYRNGESTVAKRVLERVAPNRPSEIRRVLQLKGPDGPK